MFKSKGEKYRSETLLCVVDTNSLIHMRDIRVARKDLGLWLWQEFTVKVSDTIIEEVQRPRKHRPSQHVQRNAQIKNGHFKTRLINWKTRSCNHSIQRGGDKNKGELHNCCVALEATISDKHVR